MLPCLPDRRKVTPIEANMSAENLTETKISGKPEEVCASQKLTHTSADYRIFQAIGVGCFGAATISIAQHMPSHLFVVLRLVDLEILSATQLEDVQNEMKLSQMLQHENIAVFLTSFVVGSKLWAIQPLMHYGSCADIMHSAQPFRNGFKENVIAHILRDVICGLDYLHTLGYVHRGIRAKHFLIHEDGIVKLSGLRNIASMIDEGARVRALHGHFGSTVDNICWLAPEVLAQDLSGYTNKSDMYSTGIAALELSTGEAPFAGLPVTEIMMLKLRGHPPVLMKKQDSKSETQLSNMLSKVIDMCVDPDPVKRPTAAKLLSTSFFRSRKKSLLPTTLKELLLPVVPLDISRLNPVSVAQTGLESKVETLRTMENWTL